MSTSSEFAASDKPPVLIIYKEKDFPIRPTASKTSLNSFVTPAADFEEDTKAAENAAVDDAVNFFKLHQ